MAMMTDMPAVVYSMMTDMPAMVYSVVSAMPAVVSAVRTAGECISGHPTECAKSNGSKCDSFHRHSLLVTAPARPAAIAVARASF